MKWGVTSRKPQISKYLLPIGEVRHRSRKSRKLIPDTENKVFFRECGCVHLSLECRDSVGHNRPGPCLLPPDTAFLSLPFLLWPQTSVVANAELWGPKAVWA